VITGTGSITKTGASIQALSGLNTSGGISIDDGSLQFDNTNTTGIVNVNNGGTLAGSGSISGDVVVNDGGRIAPGPALGDFDVSALTLSTGSILDFDLSTSGFGDRIDVAGLLTLNGGAINIFDPTGLMAPGNYTLLDYGTLLGDVASLGTPTGPAGYNYSLVDTGSLIRLVVAEIPAGVSGDFNSDGVVDAGDYIIWLKNRDTANPLPNDDNIGGVVGEQHYNLWKSNFGRVFEGSGGGQGGVVPEPAAAILVVLGAWAMTFGRRER
jgi:autotransporter-associated beta strand protein